MARWEPNARERLQQAAWELFDEKGYDKTTVADIAARADLTQRTFFRYFTDKRDVLFSGSEQLDALLASSIANAPASEPPLEVVVAALSSTSPAFEARRGIARKRMTLIAAHAELRERELMKMTKLTETLAAGLRARGISPTATALLAQMGTTLFLHAFERWVDDAKKRDLAHHMQVALAELRALTGPAPARRGKRAR